MSKDLIHNRRQDSLSSPLGGPQSLASRIRAAVATVKAPGSEVAPEDLALLLDTTGSMHGSPIRKLREAVRDFKGLRRFVYANDIQELRPGQEIREPSGGNQEPRAFRHLKSLGIRRVILVTDGYPDSPDESLEAAAGLKIDIIYIGPPPPPEFLVELARRTGGTYDGSVKFAAADGSRQLSGRIRGLLPAPKGAIEL